MSAKKTERSINALMDMISYAELQLPEIKRGYKWSRKKAAELIARLYHGHPTEQLLFWSPNNPVQSRPFSVTATISDQIRNPIYLVDGEQRLTALYRVLSDHPDACVVFNIDTEEFRLQGSSTAASPWIRVFDVMNPSANHWALVEKYSEFGKIAKSDAAERIQRLASIRYRDYDIKILTDISYRDISVICRQNHGGDPWTPNEKMIAACAIQWPGILETLQAEAAYWKAQSYPDIDEAFLTYALIATFHGDISAWSQAFLETSSGEDLRSSWKVVQRGLRHLVPLLKKNLQIVHSSMLPSTLLLLPLMILLGERPDERMEEEEQKGILYWLLVASTKASYKPINDDRISQDIAAVRGKSPVWGLHNNLGTIGTRVKVTAKNVSGPYQNHSYRFLSLLTARAKGAHDWWYGIEVAAGGGAGQRLEDHHIHPQATLANHANGYSKAEINDLGNIAFISGRANRNISDRAPVKYFPAIPINDLKAQSIPLDEDLRLPNAYRAFLVKRRNTLARAMTDYLNRHRPSWLDAGEPDSISATSELKFARYKTTWDLGKIVAHAIHESQEWSAVIEVPTLLAVFNAAAEEIDGEDFDDGTYEEGILIEIGGQNIPVHIEDDVVSIQFGPFLVGGTVVEWTDAVNGRRRKTKPLAECPNITTVPWTSEPVKFPVTRIT